MIAEEGLRKETPCIFTTLAACRLPSGSQVNIYESKTYILEHYFFHTSLKESGVEFDRSRKEEPFAFTIGSSQVILIRMLLNKYRRKCIFVKLNSFS